MSEAPQILLEHRLKTLKLPTFLREYDKVARQCAHEGLDHVAFLARLVELELIDRERRLIERRIKAAKFPTLKSLDTFQFKAIPSLNKAQVLELARCEWIERRENVIALGPSGTGKTHVSLGLGLAACQKALSVRFITAAALVHELMEARDERRLLRLQKQLAHHKLLIIDELGFVPLSKTGAELLFEVVSQRYERAAVLIYVIWNISLGGTFPRFVHGPRPSITSGAVGKGWESPLSKAPALPIGDVMDKQPGEVRWERFPSVAALPEAKQWLGIQSMLGLAHNTIEAYGRGLEDFLGWCGAGASRREQCGS